MIGLAITISRIEDYRPRRWWDSLWEAIIQAVLKRRLRTSFGGPDESEASKWDRAGNRFGFGGPDQSDKSKWHIAENRFGFGGPDNIKTK